MPPIHHSCKSLSEELSDYYRGHHSSHAKHHSQTREKDRRPQEVNISLLYFHGKDNVEAYLDWDMKVEQLFACHHISEERKVPLAKAFKGMSSIGGLPLLGNKGFMGILQ